MNVKKKLKMKIYMAKKFELKERGTNEVVYPVTATNCVLHDGQQLDTIINNKAEITDLSNVIAENVMDDDTFEPVDQITREDLKKDLFIDLWNNACGSYGKYNEETGYFELNGLTDITYSEAILIYNHKSWSSFPKLNNCKDRTNLPYDARLISLSGQSLSYSSLEVFRLCSGSTNISGFYCFLNCKKLHTIIGMIKIEEQPSLPFGACTNLQNITIYANRSTLYIDLKDSPLLTFDSVKYSVDNSVNGITITVHPDIYQALTGIATYPFNGGTQEKWQQLLIDATEKNITFATT